MDINIDDDIFHNDKDSPNGRHSEIQNTAITRIVHPHLMTIMILKTPMMMIVIMTLMMTMVMMIVIMTLIMTMMMMMKTMMMIVII